MKTRGLTLLGLAPAVLVMIATLLMPIAIIVAVSFATRGAYGGFEFDFTTEAYQSLLYEKNWSDELEFTWKYLLIGGRTLLLAGLTTLFCLLIGFPVAYYIAQQPPRIKALLIFLVTLPFWVSMIVRVYSWIIILGNNGVIEQIARALLITDDMDTLLFTSGAMLAGLVYSYIPLMILPIYASVEKLDRSLIEASHDLYGGRGRTFRRVIWPLTLPGAAAGALLVFIPSLGAILEPVLLGGGRNMMLGNLIALQFGGGRNWPLGSAIAIVLICLVLLIVTLRALRAGRRSEATT